MHEVPARFCVGTPSSCRAAQGRSSRSARRICREGREGQAVKLTSRLFTHNWERRPPVAALDPDLHKPTPHPDGSLTCSGCTGRYSPAAFEAHLAGASIGDTACGVFVLGMADPWLDQKPAPKSPTSQYDVSHVLSEDRRAALIAAYYAQERKRRRPQTAEGVGSSMTD